MGRIEVFLDNEFKRCVHMYVGSSDHRYVRYWISGFDNAIRQAFPDETGDLIDGEPGGFKAISRRSSAANTAGRLTVHAR